MLRLRVNCNGFKKQLFCAIFTDGNQMVPNLVFSDGTSMTNPSAMAVKEKLAAQGFDFAPTSPPSAFSQQIRDDLVKWVPIVKASGAKVD